MTSTPNLPAVRGNRGNLIPRVIVATTALLSFISFWRAAAIVLNDLASSAYYAGGEAEGYVGKAAPWFILGIMLFSYAVRAIYVESCSMFVRGGVYRVVKEAMGGTLAKFSVSALMFDYILTGPISGVSAGQYIVGLINETLAYIHIHVHVPPDAGAASFAVLCTVYFWWYNVKGVHESSQKAMRIMQITTVMVVILIGWCIYTTVLRHPVLPPIPHPRNLKLGPNALGWLYGIHLAHFAGPMPLLAPLMVPIELVSHLARPLSLTIRLFANMYAGEQVTMVFLKLTFLFVPAVFMGLHVFVSFLQAYIFTFLTALFMGMALHPQH